MLPALLLERQTFPIPQLQQRQYLDLTIIIRATHSLFSIRNEWESNQPIFSDIIPCDFWLGHKSVEYTITSATTSSLSLKKNELLQTFKVTVYAKQYRTSYIGCNGLCREVSTLKNVAHGPEDPNVNKSFSSSFILYVYCMYIVYYSIINEILHKSLSVRSLYNYWHVFVFYSIKISSIGDFNSSLHAFYSLYMEFVHSIY